MVENNWVFKSYCSSNKKMLFFLKNLKQDKLNILIEQPKEKYYFKLSSRLTNPLGSAKAYG